MALVVVVVITSPDVIDETLEDKNGGRTVERSPKEEAEILARWEIGAEEKSLKIAEREQKKSLQSKSFDKLTAGLDENERASLKERFAL